MNIDWRKGTGLSTSPSDRGRDIQAEREQTEIDGSRYLEKWFIECKQHVKGVPPEKLQNILAWAAAERADKILIIASNFLSNPAKDYFKNYEESNRPLFKIRYWELPDLERLTLDKGKLKRKYNLGAYFPHLEIMHPAHVLFLRDHLLNSAGYFFDTLDRLDPTKRDEVLSFAYGPIIQPRYRKSVTGKETLGELMIDDLSYAKFRNSFMARAEVMGDSFLISSIVHYSLQALFHLGDYTSTDKFIDEQRYFVENFKEQLEISEDENQKEALTGLIEMFQQKIKSWPSEVKRNYAMYEYFCEHVVQKLLLEPLHIELPEDLGYP